MSCPRRTLIMAAHNNKPTGQHPPRPPVTTTELLLTEAMAAHSRNLRQQQLLRKNPRPQHHHHPSKNNNPLCPAANQKPWHKHLPQHVFKPISKNSKKKNVNNKKTMSLPNPSLTWTIAVAFWSKPLLRCRKLLRNAASHRRRRLPKSRPLATARCQQHNHWP